MHWHSGVVDPSWCRLFEHQLLSKILKLATVPCVLLVHRAFGLELCLDDPKSPDNLVVLIEHATGSGEGRYLRVSPERLAQLPETEDPVGPLYRRPLEDLLYFPPQPIF
jgi:hypothetical protein